MKQNCIDIKNLKFCYPNSASSKALLEIRTLNIASGERVFLQGESGSGKSTLLSIIAGILNPQKGQVSILGHDFVNNSRSTKDKIRGQKMGYIFQLFNLIPYLSVQDNIALPCLIHKARREKISGDLTEAVNKLSTELNIHDLLHKKVQNLSVGQQQRVAAARALIGQPELIVADEPTSALDHKHRSEFVNLLMKQCQAQNSTLLFVSHDPTLESLFDRKLKMQEVNRGL